MTRSLNKRKHQKIGWQWIEKDCSVLCVVFIKFSRAPMRKVLNSSVKYKMLHCCCALESWGAKRAQICFESKCKKALITTWSSPHTVLLHAILGSTIQFFVIASEALHTVASRAQWQPYICLCHSRTGHLALPPQIYFPLKTNPTMNYEACITIEKFEASDPNNHEKNLN